MSAPTPAPGDDRPREGYYPDPSIPGYVRYWNGASWVPGTSRPAPTDGVPLAPPPGARPASVPAPAPAPAEETGPHFFDEDPEPAAGARPVDPAEAQHGSRPEPASAWGADRSRQGGFGGDQDRRISWGAPQGADPRVPHAAEPGDAPARPDGRSARTDGTTPIPPADPAEPPAPGGTVVFRRPVTDAPKSGPAGAGSPASGATGTPGSRDDRADGRSGAGTGAAASSAPAASSAQAQAQAQAAAAAAPSAGPAADGSPGVPGSRGPAAEGTMTFRTPAQRTPRQGEARAAGTATPAAAPQPATAPRSAPVPAPQPAPAPPPAPAPAPQPGPVAGSAPAPAPVPQQPSAPVPPVAGAPLPMPMSSGAGGGQPSWAQQVHQLAGAGAGAGAAAGEGQPVAPWKPPVDDVFQAAARAQAAARPAGLGRRLAARLVDTVVLAAVTGAAAVPLGTKAIGHVQDKIDAAKLSGETVTVWLLDGTTATCLGIVLAVLLLFGVLYEALPTSKWGRTLGKKLCGIQVRDIEGHEPPAFSLALRRWLVYSIPGVLVIGIVGVAWCLFDRPWHQCWHDKAAHTFVAA
ncbi:RDD family protein [Streptomyces sp. NPDC059785]|uniref:RDD family protein n=1 Tax=unclassified Streptomyces TaxID=2593676 RepID=UPI0036695B55